MAARSKATGNAQRAQFCGVFGATGTGKSTYLRALLAKRRKRLLVWSPKEKKDNYAGLVGGQLVRTAAEVHAALTRAGHGPFCLVFHPSLNRKRDEAQFDAVCRMLLAAENCTLLVEELHTVTLATWAPEGWKNVTLMGRASGLEVIATSQRPAQVDKSFFSSLTTCRSGRLLFEEDAKVLARSLLVPAPDLMALPDFHFVERIMDGGEPSRGKLR